MKITNFKFSLFVISLVFILFIFIHFSFDRFYKENNEIIYYLFIVSTISSIILAFIFRNSVFFRWFSSINVFIVLSLYLTLACIFIGVIPQKLPSKQDNISFFSNITSTLLWGLLFFTFLFSLTSTIARRTKNLNIRDFDFYFVHIGVWLVLFFAALNSFRSERYIMAVELNKTEWRVYDEFNNLIELPLAIQLDSIKTKDETYDISKRKIFTSRITVYTKNGIEQSAWVKVNKPFNLINWTIYKRNNNPVDSENISVFILAYNPYWNQILIGIFFLTVGIVVLFYKKCIKIKN